MTQRLQEILNSEVSATLADEIQREVDGMCDEAYSDGYDDGLSEGEAYASTEYDNGFQDGRDEGYSEGYDEGLAVGGGSMNTIRQAWDDLCNECDLLQLPTPVMKPSNSDLHEIEISLPGVVYFPGVKVHEAIVKVGIWVAGYKACYNLQRGNNDDD